MSENFDIDYKTINNRLEPVLYKTPLIWSSYYSHINNKNIFFKPENLQKTGSFKIRGAYNKISLLDEEKLSKGIITASAGNHAQGVAYSAKRLGIKSVIVMPSTTPLIKIHNVESFGAEVVLYGDIYDESYDYALKLAQELNMTFVHPFDDFDVISGQGSIAYEILEENPDIDTIVVPCGGGGLLAGISKVAKMIKPSITIIGVEPEGAASMKAAGIASKPVNLDSVNTSAEGVAVKKVGEKTFEICKQYVDKFLTVSEEEIMENILQMIEKHKLVVEAAGVVGLSALPKIHKDAENIAVILSGGNIDTVTLATTVNKGMIKRGRIMSFSVELPDKSGQLVAVASIIAELGGNVIALNHDQFKVLDRYSNKVVLEIVCETNGLEHIQTIINTLETKGFDPKIIY